MARASALVTLLALFACGGGDETPPPGTPAGDPGASVDAAAAAAEAETPQQQDTAAADAGTVQSGGEQGATGLVRETFAYAGAGRDPFVSLISSGAVKPEPSDLRVVGIAYDSRYPQRSVATLRDISDGARYTLQSGDQVGRVRVQAIREREVVLIIEEFGLERQLVLTLSRRTQEVNP